MFVGSDEQAGRRAGGLAAAVGLAEPVRNGGLLAGGWTGWNAEGQPLAKLARVDVAAIGPYLEAGTQVLDVRERAEFEAGHIPDSLNRALA